MVIDFSTFYDSSKGIERLFEDMLRINPSFRQPPRPKVNIQENDEGYIVDICIPGVPAENVELSLTARNLIIRGELNAPEGKYFRQERRTGAFQRVLNLNTPVDRDKVSAKATDGILRVVLPKADSVKPRKIAIES